MKRFGQTPTVKDISLHIHQKDIFGFLGANGSGKTTRIIEHSRGIYAQADFGGRMPVVLKVASPNP